MLKLIATWALPVLFLFSSCRPHSEKPVTVRGSFTGASGITLILQELDTREIHSIDSVIIDHTGKFSFTRLLDEQGFWLLKAQSGKVLVMMLGPGDQVDLSGNPDDFPRNIIMKGPREAMLLNEFYRSTWLNERKADSLEMLMIDRQDSAGYFELTQKIDASFRQIWEQQRTAEMNFINNNPKSLSSLVILNYAFGMSPVLSPEEDFAYYLKLDSSLFPAFPKNKHVIYHHQRVLELKRKASLKK